MDSTSLSYEIFLPNPLDHSHVSTTCSQPSFFHNYYFDVPIDNPLICNSNVDLNRKHNVFNMLGGKINNFFPYVTLVGMIPPLIHIAYT